MNSNPSNTTSTKLHSADHPAVYVIHENDEWLIPLREAFKEKQIPWVEWFVDEGTIDPTEAPPEGVFYNRMSASSHTRSHRYAVELTGPLLAWLEAHGRRVINNRRSLQLEVRKIEQYIGLQAAGVLTPKTIAASGKRAVLEAAKELNQTPFILKPNRGGKGLGVQLFNNIEELEGQLSINETLSLDGISLIQQYVKPANGKITRMEFIGGQFYYAVEVDATGGFELCPADSCEVGDQFCPAPGEESKEKFSLVEQFEDSELISKLEHFFAQNGAEISAAEFVEDEQGRRFVYDINMNTNYNRAAEQRVGDSRKGMHRIAEFLNSELEKAYQAVEV